LRSPIELGPRVNVSPKELVESRRGDCDGEVDTSSLCVVPLSTLRIRWSCFCSCCCISARTGVSSSLSGDERRWITLIFADRNRIIMIRRELPLTVSASPVDLSHRASEDSPSCLLSLLPGSHKHLGPLGHLSYMSPIRRSLSFSAPTSFLTEATSTYLLHPAGGVDSFLPWR